GGLAFVLNVDGAFDSRCNLAMVELEKVEAVQDIQRLRELLEAHVRHTDSPKAKGLLANFEKERARFVKVIPVDYKRVLAERKARAQVPTGATPLAGAP